ncbi:UDP-N-acetylmuramate dehydrogenase [Candidatus Saccharibacteria bacterium]|nr:MAG: UDP-N-acetylmuramate dehydrogenase [Candidatus Saccharibacteria bacterium]
MQFTPSVSLANYSTMRLGGIANYLADAHTRDELVEAVAWAREKQLPVRVIGGGSNIVWQDSGFNGLVLVNKISGFELTELNETERRLVVGAGENWDSVVARTVAEGLKGIEALSLIPGTAGATPIQNVGAYGQEIAQTLESVEAYDVETGQFTSLTNAECKFGYRSSIFKTDAPGRYLITSLTLRLKVGNPLPPYYSAVQSWLEANPTDGPITPALLREAVVAIRTAKLPDPAVVANNGSFFANPVVDASLLANLKREYPEVPNWPREDGGAKIPAAWLIEQAGFKDFHDDATGMSTWPKQPLVLVNEHARTTTDLIAFRDRIVDAVAEKFGITLTQEPEILP